MYKLSSRAFDNFSTLNVFTESECSLKQTHIAGFYNQVEHSRIHAAVELIVFIYKLLILWCKHVFRSWRVNYLLENSYLTVGSQVFRQCRVQAWDYNLHLSCVLELHFNGSGILITTRNRQEIATFLRRLMKCDSVEHLMMQWRQ